MILWNSYLDGARAIPGDYQVVLHLGDDQQAVAFTVLADPRLDTTPAEFRAQFEFVSGINQKLTETHQAITRIRKTKAQISSLEERFKDDDQFAQLLESAANLKQKLTSIEETLYQTKMESRQDPLNFPIRLNDKLAGVMSLTGFGDNAPSAAAIAVRDELFAAVDAQLDQLETILNTDLATFNQQATNAALPAIGL